MRKQFDNYASKLKAVDKRYWIGIGILFAILAGASFVYRMAALPVELAKAQHQQQAQAQTAANQPTQPVETVDPFGSIQYPLNAPVSIWMLAYEARQSVWAQVAALPIGTYDVCNLHAHIDYQLTGAGPAGKWSWEVRNRIMPVVITTTPVENGLPLFDCAGVNRAQQAAVQKQLPSKSAQAAGAAQ